MLMTDEAVTSPLAGWQNFYVIVGSSAGALTGLQFVVIALIAEAQTVSSMLEIRAFGTPTVIHFCAALLIAAIASAPWSSMSAAAVAFGACGVGGVVYALRVIRHARKQTGYQPDFADWMWYAGLPLIGYLVLFSAALIMPSHQAAGLFMTAGMALLLFFIGIHNAWDTVTYIATQWNRDGKGSDQA